MSKREEIKKKEQLQLELQAQFNKLDQTVLSWLKPSGQPAKQESAEDSQIKTSFNNSIVVPLGKGLNFDTDEAKVNISQFMNATTSKDDKSTNVKKFANQSRSLQALQNKLRADQRQSKVTKPQSRFQLTQQQNQPQSKKSKQGSGSRNGPLDSDEDSEDENSRASLNSKAKPKKVNSKRPF